MEYYVADTYKNWERIGEPFEEKGKMYTKVKEPCDRCGGKGVFIVRVHNGVGIPATPDAGVCYKCGGAGHIIKTVRLYTEKEYASMQKAKANRQAKAEEARQARIAERKKTAFTRWLERNGFNEDGETYLIYGNTYPIKDQLKEAGCKFSQELKWHGSAAVDVPEDCFVEKIHWSNVYNWNEDALDMWRTEEGNEFLKGIFTSHTEGEYIGEVGERLRDMPAVLERRTECDGKFGWSIMYQFNVNGAQCVWFTQKELDLDEGAECMLTGTVKKQDTYGNTKTTYLNRCIVK